MQQIENGNTKIACFYKEYEHNLKLKVPNSAGDTNIVLLLIKFKVRGNLRYLSHAEMVKLFQRACVRAGIKTAYSRGFNPRPKLSLSLPRSVGVESDDELLCLRVVRLSSESQTKAALAEQLPQDCELLSVSTSKTDISPQPCLAKYVLTPRQADLDARRFKENLKETINRLLKSDALTLDRQIDAKGSTRKVDVRGFLKSIEFDGANITVECKITPAGSIRIEEILKLLELNAEKLAAPIRRISVQWQTA